MPDPPHPPEPTLSTLVPISTSNLQSLENDGTSPPYTPKSSTFALPSQSIVDGHPIVNPNPTLFSFLSKLALRGGSGESGPNSEYGGEEEEERHQAQLESLTNEGETESPKEVEEIDMAPDGRWEEHQQKEKRRASHLSTSSSSNSATAVDEEEEEEDTDALGSLPSKEGLDKHTVFRTPSFDSSDLANRLAQLSVSNLASRPKTLARQPSIGAGGPGISGEGVIDEEGITDEEKMEAIVEEFGPIETGRGEPEKFLYEGKGGLFRGVVIVGNMHLTTHRITFHAVLPPPSLLDSSTSTLIVKAGPVWIHKPGRLSRKRRVWMELGGEMVTTYPDSSREGRTRPLKTLMLSSIKEIVAADPEDPLSIVFKIASKKDMSARLEFDTLESALEWRREFSGSMFHHRRMKLRLKKGRMAEAAGGKTEEQLKDEAGAEAAGFGKSEDWERVRISIPLDRIIKNEAADYMGFATLMSLEINTGSHAVQPLSSPITPNVSCSSLPLDHDHVLKLQFALLSYQATFIEQFGVALDTARARRASGENELSCPPLVAMDGVFKEEIELGRQEDQEEEAERHQALEDAQPKDIESEGKVTNAKLRVIFGLTDGEALWSTPCGLQRSIIPLRGHLIISPRYIGFFRKTIAGHDIKYRFPLHEVKGAETAPTLHLSTHGLALQCAGHADTIFEFWSKNSRAEAMAKINEAVATKGSSNNSNTPQSSSASFASSGPSTPGSGSSTPTTDRTLSDSPKLGASPLSSTFPSLKLGGGRSSSPHRAQSRSQTILTAGLDSRTGLPIGQLPTLDANVYNYLPKVVNYSGPTVVDPADRKKIAPRHFVMLTIGSRGDIQPYIALSLGLMKDGHRCTIVTHNEFKIWIESFGIQHRQAGGDPEALMKLSVQHKMFSPGFFKESLGGFRGWLDDLFHDSWVACQDADVLIESPSAMAGIHIAEGLNIPYFRAFTMTWTRTQTYPHAFLVPPFEMSGSFNYSTYVLFDGIIWKATAGQINRWRAKDMGLGPTDQSHLEAMKVPFVYNFSSAVVPHPIDWKDNIMISGYWFLDDSDPDWSPPDSLKEFIQKAKDDGKALVYIGFGSIVVPHPAAMTRSIIKAVQKSDVRAIIAKGWSDRGGEVDKEGNPIVVELPEDCCYSVKKVPHDWLFTQIDAAVHHGGAGTTGASLRAGLPTIIKPWFGDQYFWGNRVASLGCGIKLNDLHSSELAAALVKATTDRVMKEAAAKIGEKIRSESGVDNAIAFFYSYLGRAVDRHASYKPVHAHGTSSPRRSATFSSAALATVATSRLHALVAGKKDRDRELKDAEKEVEAAAPELLLGFSGYPNA